ncbi:ATP-binding protein [Actinophytocola oryzae]|nr:ATP-binding protein [Actinophytocola oryzae]
MSAQKLGPVRQMLRDWATAQGLDEDTVHAIMLSGYEALANTVEHAYREQGSGTVEVHVDRSGDVVTVTVCDFGQWRDPAAPPGLRGRGLVLIDRLGTEAEVSTTGGGTEVRMTWRLPSN